MTSWRLYSKIMKSHPLFTNMVVGSALGLTGDIVCQSLIEEKETIDKIRLFSLTTFCTFYHGLVNPIIYKSYQNIIPKFLQTSSIRYGLACTTVDNLIHVPFIYTPTFFLSTNLLQGQDWNSSWNSLSNGLIPSVTACWTMWFPLQFINFTIVSSHMRATFVNIGCLVWNVAIDHISNEF